MLRVPISKGFVASVAFTTVVGFGLLSVLVKIGAALSFDDDEYFLGALLVVVLTALFDRTDHYNVSRKRSRPERPTGPAT